MTVDASGGIIRQIGNRLGLEIVLADYVIMRYVAIITGCEVSM